MLFLNLNERVKVKPTAHGIAVHEKYWENLGIPVEPMRLDMDGYYTDNLWSIMQVFGPSIMMGGSLPFEKAEIIVPGLTVSRVEPGRIEN